MEKYMHNVTVASEWKECPTLPLWNSVKILSPCFRENQLE